MRCAALLPGLCVLAAFLGTFPAGCSSDPTRGYSFTSAHSTNIRTVAVPIWNNETFQKGLEYDLTDAIIKEIQRTTPWVVVSSGGGRADTTLTGTITDANLRMLSTSSQTGMVQEMGLDVTVNFEWSDAMTGQPLASRRGFRAIEPFVPSQHSQERIELGRHAVVQELARDIVADLRNKW